VTHRRSVSLAILPFGFLLLVPWQWWPDGFGTAGQWAADRLHDFWSVDPTPKVALLQVVILAAGGYWAFHLYTARREHRPIARVEAAVRLIRNEPQRSSLLLVRIHVINAAQRMLTDLQAVAWIMDASDSATDGSPILRPFRMDDPLRFVHGKMVDAGGYVNFERIPKGWLEPGECLDTELAFPLTTHSPGLLAMRIAFGGKNREPFARLRKRGMISWGTFFYIDPDQLVSGAGYVPCHLHSDASS
jgi:hypothetical protein